MEYTVDKDDVQHVIIDNLQFLMPRVGAKSAFEKFDYQDLVVERFRKFASDKNVSTAA
jgi:twinkle protein